MNKTPANYGTFPITAGMASARIQVLEQQIASGLFGKKKTKEMRSELEALRRSYPQA